MEFLSELHPRLVHFPIVFFILYFVLETSGVIFKKDYLTKSAFLVLIFGIITAITAVLTGNQAAEAVKSIIENKAGLKSLVDQHENYATITLWYFVGLFFYRMYLVINKKFDKKFQYLFIVLGFIGCVFIVLTGYYGGDLVFKHGIGTKLFGR